MRQKGASVQSGCATDKNKGGGRPEDGKINRGSLIWMERNISETWIMLRLLESK